MNEHFKPSLFPSANNPLASVTDVCRPLEDAGRTSVLLVWAVLGVGFRDWPRWVTRIIIPLLSDYKLEFELH